MIKSNERGEYSDTGLRDFFYLDFFKFTSFLLLNGGQTPLSNRNNGIW